MRIIGIKRKDFYYLYVTPSFEYAASFAGIRGVVLLIRRNILKDYPYLHYMYPGQEEIIILSDKPIPIKYLAGIVFFQFNDLLLKMKNYLVIFTLPEKRIIENLNTYLFKYFLFRGASLNEALSIIKNRKMGNIANEALISHIERYYISERREIEGNWKKVNKFFIFDTSRS